jgi:CBS domain-containing protein
VREIMRPLDDLKAVSAETPASDGVTIMAREDVNQLPVRSGNWLKGIVSRARIQHLLQSRSELRT